MKQKASLMLENQSMHFIISADWRTWAYESVIIQIDTEKYLKKINIQDKKKTLSDLELKIQ